MKVSVTNVKLKCIHVCAYPNMACDHLSCNQPTASLGVENRLFNNSLDNAVSAYQMVSRKMSRELSIFLFTPYKIRLEYLL